MVKNPPGHAGDASHVGSIPGLGRSLGEGNGNPLQYYILDNAMNIHGTLRGTWGAAVHGVTELDTTW